MKNQINTSEGNVQFITPDGKLMNVHPSHVYAVFNQDTVSFLLIAMPKSSGLAVFTSTAEDLLFNGETYTFEQLKTVIPEAFAEAGAQARCEIVDELPETGKTNTIYLVPKEEGEGYDEYIYLKDEQRWELIGDTSIEMNNYLKKVDFAAYSAATDLKIDAISGAVSDEASRAVSAESALSDSIDALEGYVDDVRGITDTLDCDIDILEESLAQEASARTDADTVLSGAISSVTEDVAALSGDVTAHTSNTDIHVTAADKTAWADKYTKAETSGKTELSTAFAAKQNVLTAGENIVISGDVISAEAGNDVTELTQEQYDALVEAGTVDPDVLYIITDATPINLSNYYQKSETSGKTELSTAFDAKLDATAYTPTDLSNYYTKSETSGKSEISTALASKQDTLSAGTGIDITSNVISVTGGGGTTYTANSGLTIDSNNVIGLDGHFKIVNNINPQIPSTISDRLHIGYESVSFGYANSAVGQYSIAVGANNVVGENIYNAACSMVVGELNKTLNKTEFCSGRFNISNKANDTFGDSGNTLFSVGNGTSTSQRHNAFEIRQNGDIYLTKDGQDVKLQDQLGGSSYTAGSGIDITNDVISVTGKVDTSDFNTYSGAVESRLAEDEEVTAAAFVALNDRIGSAETAISGKADTSAVTAHTSDSTIHVTSANKTSWDGAVTASAANTTALGGLKLMKISQSDYDNLQVKDNNTLYIITD